VQQRAGEIGRILAQREVALEVYAPADEDGEQHPAAVKQRQPTAEPQVRPKAQASRVVDLLDTSAPPPSAPPPSAPRPTHGQPAKDTGWPPAEAPAQIPPGSVLAFETSDVLGCFEVQVNQTDRRQVAIRASFLNKGSVPLTRFQVTFGTPKGWAIRAQPLSGTSLAPDREAPVQQVLLLMNRGSSPLQMRAQISFLFRSQPISDVVQVNNIF